MTRPSGPDPLPAVEARRLEAGARPPAGEFSYRVAEVVRPRPVRPAAAPSPGPAAAAGGEKRTAARLRTKLRTGKILDAGGRLVTDCLVFDRSDTGSRLRLPPEVTLRGTSFFFFEDQSGALTGADVAWRRQHDVGVRFRPTPPTLQVRVVAEALRRAAALRPKS